MGNQDNKFGFTQFAETWNGRLAMLGFVVAAATEYFTGQGYFILKREVIYFRLNWHFRCA